MLLLKIFVAIFLIAAWLGVFVWILQLGGKKDIERMGRTGELK